MNLSVEFTPLKRTIVINPIKTKKQAKSYIQSLSNPSKMPCPSYGLPALESCPVGKKLNLIKDAICSDCYACKGLYQFANVQLSQSKRLKSTYGHSWCSGMVKMIQDLEYFRWHDSGDLYSDEYLEKVMAVIIATPNTLHWLPTREKARIARYLRNNDKPVNVCIRLSAAKFDSPAVKLDGCQSSGSHDKAPAIGHACQAYRTFKNGTQLSQTEYDNLEQGHGLDIGHCGDCRACWDTEIEHISYPRH